MRARAWGAGLPFGAIFVCAVLAFSCATSRKTAPPSNAAATATVADPYVGVHKDDVIAEWGKPARVELDVNGHEILVYDIEKRVAVDARRVPPPDASDPTSAFTRTVTLAEDVAKFYLDADGRVRRTWFAAEIWKDGAPTPPKKTK